MLNKLGKRTRGGEHLFGALLARVTDTDILRTLESDQQVGKREAIIPQSKSLLAHVLEYGINEAVGDAIDFHVDNALRDPNLHGADSSAEAMGTLKLMEGVAKVFEDGRREITVLDCSGELAENGVAKLADATCSHGSILRRCCFGQRFGSAAMGVGVDACELTAEKEDLRGIVNPNYDSDQ